jgi:hypothetical protein
MVDDDDCEREQKRGLDVVMMMMRRVHFTHIPTNDEGDDDRRKKRSDFKLRPGLQI